MIYPKYVFFSHDIFTTDLQPSWQAREGVWALQSQWGCVGGSVEQRGILLEAHGKWLMRLEDSYMGDSWENSWENSVGSLTVYCGRVGALACVVFFIWGTHYLTVKTNTALGSKN